MRILIQRVSRAAVTVEGREVGRIDRGLLLFVGIGEDDTSDLLQPMAHKLANLRLFPDAEGRSHFDRSALEVGADLLVVSQFTLHANCRKGRRPSFDAAAGPARAETLIAEFAACLREYPLRVETGEFGAHMDVESVNDGPVTIWLDSAEAISAPRAGVEKGVR